jgi:hypothetical protein
MQLREVNTLGTDNLTISSAAFEGFLEGSSGDHTGGDERPSMDEV